MATRHVDEVLAKALSSDSAVIPRFDIKDASGNTVVANAQLVLKNTVTTAGTKINKKVLDEFLAASGTTAGYAIAYTLDQAGFTLVDGALVRIKLHVASGANPTLNINGTGAKALMQSATRPLVTGIAAGTWLTFVYSSTLGFFLQQGGDGAGTVVLDKVWTQYNASLTRTAQTELSTGRSYLAGAGVGNYALFGGGTTGNGDSNVVDAYNTSLTRTTPIALSTARSDLAGASVGNYALFGGGNTGSNDSNVVDAYNASLTRTTPTELSTVRRNLAGASVGNYALFGGGTYSSVVDAYNASLTRTTPTALSAVRSSLAGAGVGNYALFGGGTANSTYSSVVDAYNASLTRTTPTALSTGRGYLAGASVGNYALFGGGAYSNVVDAYNASLTRTTPTALSAGRNFLAGASVGDYALFGGGDTGSDDSSVVDAYNASLTRTTPTVLSIGRRILAGASVGNYALFGGGFRGYSSYNTYAEVDAYSPPGYLLDITVPAWSSYYINGVTSAETLTFSDLVISARSETPFTGYIKRGLTLSGQI